MGSNKKRKKPIKTRDYNMVNIIKGVTKAGVHKDKKKEANKRASREKVEMTTCLQCGFPFSEEENIEAGIPCAGFCSFSCFDYYTEPNNE